MKYEDMTKEELIRELSNLNQCFINLERSESGLKDAESALSLAEEKYRNIFENATEGIFQTSLEGRFISANPSLARIHGYDSPDDLINSVNDMAYQLYADPEGRAELIRLLHRDGAVENYEVKMCRKDKTIQWISINVKTVSDKTGKSLYYEGTMQDITQRKEAEGALRESEEQYRTAIEHSNDGVAIVHGSINQYVNRRFIEMFEYDEFGDVVGKSIMTVVHPDDVGKVSDINRRRRQGKTVPSRYEFKGITKNGKTIYIEVSATSTTFRGDTVYLIYMRDITERKLADDALRTERNRFQTLSENAPFGIALVDSAGSFTYINPKFIEIFGYTLEDVPTGRMWYKKAYPDREYRRKAVLDWLEDIRNTKPGEKMPRTFDVTCKDGSIKTINLIPVRLVGGEHIISFEDITERIEAHKALIKSHKELGNLNRAKTKAVNHISHELKTPLAVIQGNIRILKRKLQAMSLMASFQGLIEPLERNLERLFDISRETDEIFSVSQELEGLAILDELDRIRQRMETITEVPENIIANWEALKNWIGRFLSGSMANFQTIDIFPFIQSFMEKIKPLASHRKIDFVIEGENFLYISIDPVIIKDIVEGLVKNAIENTPDGGKIQISVEQKEDRIWLHIRDFGVGITEENRQYIFDGLFHTRETEMYSSKKPYDFGAGGKGLELLRMKINGKRFGFDITCVSRRCIFIPTDHDTCPGDISLCEHSKSMEDCKNSGGTTFSVSFPIGTASA